MPAKTLLSIPFYKIAGTFKQMIQFYDLETFETMIEYVGPWDIELLSQWPWQLKWPKSERRKNLMVKRLHLQGPAKCSLLNSLLWEAPQAPGGRPWGSGEGRTKARITAAFKVGTLMTFHPLPPWRVNLFKRDHLVTSTTLSLVFLGYTLNQNYNVLI